MPLDIQQSLSGREVRSQYYEPKTEEELYDPAQGPLEGNQTEVSSLLDRFLEKFHEIPAGFTHRLTKDLFSIMQATFAQGGVGIRDLTKMVLDQNMQIRNFIPSIS